MIDLVARIGGKTVSYPKAATFVVEQRAQGARYHILTYRDDIDSALGKYNRSIKPKHITRLSAVHEGRIIPLARA